MAYPADYYTDIKNLTRQTPTNSLMDWAVAQAKTFYIAGDPATYNDATSLVDNRLVSILAAGFIGLYSAGFQFGTNFTLDEFTFEQNDNSQQEQKFFVMFNDWLNKYRMRGVTLQYVDNGESMIIAPYDATLYVIDRDNVEGLET